MIRISINRKFKKNIEILKFEKKITSSIIFFQKILKIEKKKIITTHNTSIKMSTINSLNKHHSYKPTVFIKKRTTTTTNSNLKTKTDHNSLSSSSFNSTILNPESYYVFQIKTSQYGLSFGKETRIDIFFLNQFTTTTNHSDTKLLQFENFIFKTLNKSKRYDLLFKKININNLINDLDEVYFKWENLPEVYNQKRDPNIKDDTFGLNMNQKEENKLVEEEEIAKNSSKFDLESYILTQHPFDIIKQQIFDKIFKIDFLGMTIKKREVLDFDMYLDWLFSIKDYNKRQLISDISDILNFDLEKETGLIDLFLKNIVYLLQDNAVLLNKHN